MKHAIVASVLAVTMATPVLAADYTINAQVTDHFTTKTRNVPNTERVCETVEVPIYGYKDSNASTGDAIVGAIIGGAIGNQFGSGSGKDAMTVLGAIAGADVANKKGRSEHVTGYRLEQRCNKVTTYTTVTEDVYSHSTVKWREGGRDIVLRFKR